MDNEERNKESGNTKNAGQGHSTDVYKRRLQGSQKRGTYRLNSIKPAEGKDMRAQLQYQLTLSRRNVLKSDEKKTRGVATSNQNARAHTLSGGNVKQK